MSEKEFGIAIQVERWTLEKFEGNPPTRITNGLRRAVGYGPKQPVEIVTGGKDLPTVVSVPEPPSKWWFIYHLTNWIKEKIYGAYQRWA